MEKKMETDMEAGILLGIIVVIVYTPSIPLKKSYHTPPV